MTHLSFRPATSKSKLKIEAREVMCPQYQVVANNGTGTESRLKICLLEYARYAVEDMISLGSQEKLSIAIISLLVRSTCKSEKILFLTTLGARSATESIVPQRAPCLSRRRPVVLPKGMLTVKRRSPLLFPIHECSLFRGDELHSVLFQVRAADQNK